MSSAANAKIPSRSWYHLVTLTRAVATGIPLVHVECVVHVRRLPPLDEVVQDVRLSFPEREPNPLLCAPVPPPPVTCSMKQERSQRPAPHMALRGRGGARAQASAARHPSKSCGGASHRQRRCRYRSRPNWYRSSAQSGSYSESSYPLSPSSGSSGPGTAVPRSTPRAVPVPVPLCPVLQRAASCTTPRAQRLQRRS